jgi:hypothetical protein
MAVTGNSCFLLADFFKIFSSETVLPVSEVWNMGYSAPWTLLNNLFSSPGW